MQNLRPARLFGRARVLGDRATTSRRFVRYGLVGLNVALLLGIAWFTLGPSHRGQSLGHQGVLSAGDDVANEPLDQLSSADIAASVALATVSPLRTAGIPETTAIINQADSVKAEQAVASADTTVVAKPQIVATALKSRRDIKEYIVVPGDTVSSLASRFSVTSDSIMWSNNLRGNTLTAGLKLLIPPEGYSGIVYTVQNGDTVDRLAEKFRAGKDQIIAFNDIELTGLKVGERILILGGRQPAPVIVRPVVGSYGYNGYDFGFCTWYVANRRAAYGKPVPSNLGNASTWDNRAEAMGISVSKTAMVGDAAVTSQRGAGHVAFVEAINADGSIWISEMNSYGQVSMTNSAPTGGWNRVDWKLVPAGTAASFNYIH